MSEKRAVVGDAEYTWSGELRLDTDVSRNGGDPMPFSSWISMSNGDILVEFREAGIFSKKD